MGSVKVTGQGRVGMHSASCSFAQRGTVVHGLTAACTVLVCDARKVRLAFGHREAKGARETRLEEKREILRQGERERREDI